MLFLLLGGIFLLAALYFLRILLLSRDPANLVRVTGSLVKTVSFRNVPIRYGGKIRLQTDFVYTYTVNGKTYRCKGRKNVHRRTLPQRADIVFVKNHPRFAYIGTFGGANETGFAICFLLWCIFFVGMGILFLTT